MPIALSELAERLGAELDGAQVDHVITGVSSIAGAGPGCLVFAEEEASFAAAMASGAGAVLVGQQMMTAGALSQFCAYRSRGWPLPVPPCCCVLRSLNRPSTLPP